MNPTTNRRTQLNVNIEADTRTALQALAASYGATVAALVEALACALAEHLPADPLEPLDGVIDVAYVITEARRIAAERRAR